MRRELSDFLHAEDLNDLLRARERLGKPTKEDTALIRAIISEWSEPQLIANLLFYPALIPEDLPESKVGFILPRIFGKIGVAEYHLGNIGAAINAMSRAAELCRQSGDTYGEKNYLENLELLKRQSAI